MPNGMDDYWSTRTAERRQQRRRQRERLISIIEIEPQRKGRRGTAALDDEFRRQVRADLMALELAGWPRAPLVVDFGFATTKRQPAGIEAYAKHYQDLLEPRDRSDDFPPFLFRSDRQIKMLFVRCSHWWGRATSPHITLSCQPRRHVIAELEAANRLGYLEDDDWENDTPRLDTDNADWEARVAARQAEQDPDDAVAAWLAAYGQYETLRVRQDAVLHINDRALTGLLVSRAASLVTSRPDPLWRELTRLGLADDIRFEFLAPAGGRQLLDIIRVPLPSLPTAAGRGTQFRQDALRALERFVDQRPFLRPLLVPLRITLLVVPPAQGKDLDNIVLSVMSAVNNTLQPHPEPWVLAPSLAGAEGSDDLRADARKRLRSTVEVGVVAYQVIELARAPDDPPNGTLSMVLGHGGNYTSTWEAAADYVDKRLERDD
jgi:hypothetical protein